MSRHWMSRLAAEISGKPERPKADHHPWTPILSSRFKFSDMLLSAFICVSLCPILLQEILHRLGGLLRHARHGDQLLQAGGADGFQ